MSSRTERQKANQRKYRESHKEEQKIYLTEWIRDNPDKVSKIKKRWRSKHPNCDIQRYEKYKIVWRTWFINNGYIPPSPEFHYHHVDPETKKFEIGDFTTAHPCSLEFQNIMQQELKKCILLSIPEHMKLHRALRR